MNRKKVLIWMLCIVGSIVLAFGAVYAYGLATYEETMYTGSEEMGNTTMNLSYGGIAAEDDEWIYYRNHSDHDHLYKIRKDGTQKAKIIDDSPYNLNVHGDWIYYSNEYYYGHMYKIKKDGTQRTKLNDDMTDHILIKGDWIYYTSAGTDISGTDYQMRKMNVRDNKNSNLLEINNRRSKMLYRNISEDALYFVLKSQQSWLYKTDLEGNDIEIVNKEATIGAYLYEGWIYYMNGDDEYRLYKIKPNGSSKTKISDDMTRGYNIKDGWIYYNNGNDEYKIYKMKLDGSEKTKVADISYGMTIVGDWIYYQTDSYGTTYRVRLDGTDNQIVD